MKILLIMPDAGIHRLRLGQRYISLREAPLTLTMLAALVPRELNAEITLVDESIDALPVQAAPDLVGISCLTGTAPRAYMLADQFRNRGIPVVLGGVHASILPEEAAGHADAIVIGFAEKAWPELLHDFSRGCLHPVYHGQPGELAGLPFPRRDLQRRFGYTMPNTVMATRGCKGTCDFCTVPAVPYGWHTRPVAEVIDEIRAIPSKRFVFNDVSLAEDVDYARELFSAMIPLKKQWGGLITTRGAENEALLDLMAQSGCRYLLLGFESGDEASLQQIHKGFNRVGTYRDVVANLHRRGITIQGCFIFGMDQDTTDVFDRTVALVNDLKIDIPRFAIYTPYPGTAAFARLNREGRLLHRNWEFYDTQHVVFQPARMSVRELERGFRRAYRETFRLASIARRLSETPRPAIAFIGNMAYCRYVRRLQMEAGTTQHTGLTPVALEVEAPLI
jgi:radical SAM superfamily enzyme YgiQ (UPF0313 family)